MAKAGNNKRKTPNPGRKARKTTQKKVKRYSKLRDDLQVEGVLPVTPEGAVRPEVVDPRTQGEQVIVSIPLRAASEGWAVPAEKKVRVVDELVRLVEAEPDLEGQGGVSPVVKVMAANALGKLDQIQHERDHPELKAKSDTNVNVQVNANLWQPIFQGQGREMPDPVEERLKQLEGNGELGRGVAEGGPDPAGA